MAMTFDDKKKILRFDVPNSEANLDAQHFGIVDRSVGSYYMSENYKLCEEFFVHFSGEYLLDISLTVRNVKLILKELIENNYENAFKHFLKPQMNYLKALEWMLDNGDYFYEMRPPCVNEQKKYLKLDNEDNVVNAFRSLILGDLCSIYIKKIGNEGFIFYIDKNPKFNELIKNNSILKWMK